MPRRALFNDAIFYMKEHVIAQVATDIPPSVAEILFFQKPESDPHVARLIDSPRDVGIYAFLLERLPVRSEENLVADTLAGRVPLKPPDIPVHGHEEKKPA